MPTNDRPPTGPPDGAPATTPPSRPDDEEIFCPLCGYNLTGNLTGRCPECASLFSREQLLAVRWSTVEPVMPWERTDDYSLPQRFWRTLRISFFHPREFALAFAVQPVRSRAPCFYLVCLLAIAANGLAIGLLARRAHGELPVWFFPPALVVPIVASDLVVGLLYTALYPHADRRRHWGPWRAIIQYASAHWLMTWAVPLLALLLPFDVEPLLVLGVCAPCIWIGCGLLWLLTLQEVVRWRTQLGRGQTHAAFITFLVAAPVWIGSFVGIVALLVLVRVL